MKRLLAVALFAIAARPVLARPAESSADPVPNPAGATRRVIAGRPEYDRSSYFKFHFGEGYRTVWTTPYETPVLDLATFAGGLTPVRQVGSMQSIGLALKGKDGKSYTFRTIDKDPTRILPPEWKHSFPATLFQDQTVASHPGAAVIVPALAEAAGVPHTNPQLVYLPRSAALGEFGATFGDQAGTIDEYPTAAGGGHAGFLGATELIGSGELWERWRRGEGAVDVAALVRARVFDLFLGDWDRHNGQWRWMKLPGRNGFVPLPEDRDQAFADFSGAMLKVARGAQPKLVKWRDDYRNLPGLLVQGREVDDWLLTGAERPVFEEAARDLQARLTDAVIENAVRRVPPEWYAKGGEDLVRDLKKRRDLLHEAAAGFYANLAKWVDVQGTDQNDVARLVRESDGSATLELAIEKGGATGPVYFRRRFLPKETKELRLYLYGGADRFTATGPEDGIKVRVSAGAGNDHLDDSQSGGTRFYDVADGGGEVRKGPGTGVSTRPWTRVSPKKEAPWVERRDFGSVTLFAPLVWWEPDPGIVLQVTGTRYSYGFRKEPYATMQIASLQWKTARSAFAASYAADIRWNKPGFTTYLDLSADGAKNYNFYGFGNETRAVDFDDLDALEEFNEVHQRVFNAYPSVAYENRRRTFRASLGPEIKYSKTTDEDNFLEREKPYGFGDFGQVGVRGTLVVDSRGRSLAGLGSAGFAPGRKRSDTGVKLEVEGRFYPKAWDVTESFGTVSGALTGYWQVASRLTLAGRVGGQKVFGLYPWYEAAFIGGSDSVRGYDRNRFAGDSAAYANAQAVVPLFTMNLVLPLRVGVIGLADAGRVWLEGESSEKWHTSGGGGIFLRLLTTDLVVHGLLAGGDEGVKFYVNIGFGI